MPLFDETISIPTASGDTTNVHLFSYGLDNNIRNPEKKLICTDSCMSYNKINFSEISDEQKEKLLNNGCRFNGYFVRTICGPYDLCLKIWATHKSRIMWNYPKVNHPEPDPSVALDAIVVDRNGDYFGVSSGPHLGFCQAQDLKLAGVMNEEISLPLAGVKLYFQKTQLRPTEIPYSAYRATFTMPEIIIKAPKPESTEQAEEVDVPIVSIKLEELHLSDPIPVVVKDECEQSQSTQLPEITSCSQDVAGHNEQSIDQMGINEPTV